MSVLETPRIYFSGQVTWDPIVTNNYPNFYDENDGEPVFPTALDKVAAFRAEAIAAVPKGNWNPHGTHRSTFFDSTVRGADLGGGLVSTDPFLGSPANFTGMLVDLEPFGAFSSQLFFDAMSFGIDGGYRVTARCRTRFTARYINFARNTIGAIAGIASVNWQTCFDKEGLRIDAFDSPALLALQKALEADDVLGLTVQFNAYRTIYYDDASLAGNKVKMAAASAGLQKKLTGGGFQPNPARSFMVGTIGLWRNGEPVNEPCDRVMITGPDDSPRAPTVGSAHARVTSESLTLDLSNSISEISLDRVKQNFGELTVVAIDPTSGNAVPLATFDYSQYDKDAYEQTSGIVTLPISSANAKLAASADLQLRNASGQVLLEEAGLRAIPTMPNLYMNEGDTRTPTVQVYDRGVPAGAGIVVTICVMSADGSTIESQFTKTTAADGTISFPLKGTTGSITAYVPLAGPNPPQPSQGIDPQVYTYMYVRTLPADNGIAQLAPTWENVYSRVLANWHAMAPCMDNWLNLGDEAQVRSYAALLKKLTDEAYFEHFRYMPVTRDMTAGERILLYNFLDSPPVSATAEAMAAPEKVNFARLSRKMRA